MAFCEFCGANSLNFWGVAGFECEFMGLCVNDKVSFNAETSLVKRQRLAPPPRNKQAKCEDKGICLA